MCCCQIFPLCVTSCKSTFRCDWRVISRRKMSLTAVESIFCLSLFHLISSFCELLFFHGDEIWWVGHVWCWEGLSLLEKRPHCDTGEDEAGSTASPKQWAPQSSRPPSFFSPTDTNGLLRANLHTNSETKEISTYPWIFSKRVRSRKFVWGSRSRLMFAFWKIA